MVSVSAFTERLPEGETVPEYAAYRREGNLRQGFRVPAQIGFAARGFRLSEIKDTSFHGSMFLLSNILTYSYLWNRVRVLGGAYGCGFHVDRFGNMFSMSFRDPTPDRTLDVDAGASSFLREFLNGGESLEKYVISTLNDLNPLLSAREKGAVADIRYFSGYSKEQADQIRSEILHASSETIEKACSLLDAFAEKGAVCVVGPGELIDKCDGLDTEDL
jgi:Zn-dependent M16 (insulinase) family peptidase